MKFSRLRGVFAGAISLLVASSLVYAANNYVPGAPIRDAAGNLNVLESNEVSAGVQRPTVTMNGYSADNSATIPSPTLVGCKAYSANPTAATSTRQMSNVCTLIGVQITKPFSIPELDWQFAVTAPITVTTDTVAKASAGAGIRNYVSGFQFINTSATPTELVIKDGATVIWRGYAPASMTTMVTAEFLTPLRGTAATAVNVAAGTAASIYFNVQGYSAP